VCVQPPLIPLTWSIASLASSCGAASTSFCMQWLSCLSCLSLGLDLIPFVAELCISYGHSELVPSDFWLRTDAILDYPYSRVYQIRYYTWPYLLNDAMAINLP
jgi:hypothetical protein